MNRLSLVGLWAGLWAVGAVVAVGNAALGQSVSSEANRAVAPAPEELHGPALKLAWKAEVPLIDRSDAVALVQLVEDQVFVQLRSGWILAFDAATGTPLWKQKLHNDFVTVFPVAVNPKFVFVQNGTRFFAFERRNGTELFVKDLPTVPAVAPIADAENVYLSLGNDKIVKLHLPRTEALAIEKLELNLSTEYQMPRQRSIALTATKLEDERLKPVTLAAVSSQASLVGSRTPSLTVVPTLRPPYTSVGSRTPSIGLAQSLRAPYSMDSVRSPSIAGIPRLNQLALITAERPKGPQPTLEWEFAAYGRIEGTPMQLENLLFFPIGGRELTALLKKKEARKEHLFYHRELPSTLAVPMTQYGDVAIVASRDAYVRAYNLFFGRELWRENIIGVTTRKPYVTDDAVFLVTSNGLVKLDLQTGRTLWRRENVKADRILAINPMYIYALDRVGELYIYNRQTGDELTSLNLRNFSVATSNEQDDRLFLASPDGLLICLRHEDLVKPVLLNRFALPNWQANDKKDAIAPAAPKDKDPALPPEGKEKDKESSKEADA